MRNLPIGFAFITALISLAPLDAQVVTGNIEGWIKSEDGAPLAAAAITASAPGVRARTALSDARGHFVLLGLPPARYHMAVQLIGREGAAIDEVAHVGQTVNAGVITLRARPITIPGLTAEAERPVIDPAATVIGGTVSEKQFDGLPIGRDFQTLPVLLPHVSTSYLADGGLDYAGATSWENQVFVDGSNVTDPFRGATSVRLPYNFVREVEVGVGGYQAEYRGALGANLNAVTESGDDNFRSSAFAFYTDNRLSRPSVQEEINQERNLVAYDVGASISGPVMRDHVWFFAAYNPTIVHKEVGLSGFGFPVDRTVTHRYAGKLTWDATNRTRVTVTTAGDPSTRDAVGETWSAYATPSGLASPTPLLGSFREGGTTVSLRATHLPSDRVLLESALERTTARETIHGRSACDGAMFMDTLNLLSGCFPEHVNDRSTRLGGSFKVTWALRGHQFKSGFDVEHVNFDQYDIEHFVRHVSATSFREFLFDSETGVASTSYGVFAQDSWLVAPRVRLNLGVRWAQERFYGSDDDLSANLRNEWQPRVGAIYELGASHRTKLSGSFGRFYQTLYSSAASFYYAYGTRFRSAYYDHDPQLDQSGQSDPDYVSARLAAIDSYRGQYFDEWTLGVERALGDRGKIAVRGIHRGIGRIVEDGDFTLGNPGEGTLDYFPKPRRDYSALELALETGVTARGFLMASYTLSRNYGNYTGLVETDHGYRFPNVGGAYDRADWLVNATGLLPNDRTHMFKAASWYKLADPLTLGSFFTWQSGTPRSEFGDALPGDEESIFYSKRGTQGRTPALADLNFRIAYQAPLRLGSSRPRILLDVFHLISSNKVVAYNQEHYVSDGTTNILNPDYGKPIAHAPSASLRLGAEMNF